MKSDNHGESNLIVGNGLKLPITHIPETENLTKPTTHSIVNPSINPVIELNSTK